MLQEVPHFFGERPILDQTITESVKNALVRLADIVP
jgi:hypothetical protein